MRGEDAGIVAIVSGNARITPACAGKTENGELHHRSPPDHPRMRGEDGRTIAACGPGPGSPPHARGRHRDFSTSLR